MSEINYKRVDELVELCQKIYPEVDRYILWVMACDYVIKEEQHLEIEENEEYKDINEKCKNEFKIKEYNNNVIIND